MDLHSNRGGDAKSSGQIKPDLGMDISLSGYPQSSEITVNIYGGMGYYGNRKGM